MKHHVFGKKSEAILTQVHPKLFAVTKRALELSEVDFSLTCGYRGKAEQDDAFKRKASKVRFPNSAHNQMPSCAVDTLPYPFTNWEDPAMIAAWKKIGAAFIAASKELEIPIRWGGGIPDKSFNWDLPHFELHPWRHYA